MAKIDELLLEMFVLSKEDMKAAYKTWFNDYITNGDSFLSEEDFSGEGGDDKYAEHAADAFIKYLKQIKGE